MFSETCYIATENWSWSRKIKADQLVVKQIYFVRGLKDHNVAIDNFFYLIAALEG